MDGTTGHLPEAWAAALAELVGALDGARFPAALRRVLGLCCQFDSLVITRYAGTAPPQALFHDLDEVQAAITVAFYATGPYLLDPFYQACRNRQGPGVYRLRDIAAKGFFRSEYYRSFYRRTRIGDEIALLIPDGEDGWITLSLARRLRRAAFGEADAAALNAVFPLARDAVLRQWETPDRRQGAQGEQDIETRLALFAADQLSPREAEVVQLILSGHSTAAAADALGISPGTVKVHRRHAYAKLDVASQSELFSLATRFLMAQSG